MVSRINRATGGASGEEYRELTGKESIIGSKLSELTDAQKVIGVPGEWNEVGKVKEKGK
jgi:hypothetical protein